MRRSMQPDQEIVKTIKKLNDMVDSGCFEKLLEMISDDKQRFVLRQRHALKKSWKEIQEAAESFGMSYCERQMYRIYKNAVIELSPIADILKATLPTLTQKSTEREVCSTTRKRPRREPKKWYPNLDPRTQTCTCGLYDCVYYCRRTDSCDYALLNYKRRGCPASKDCIKYINKQETDKKRREFGRMEFGHEYEVRKNNASRFDIGFWEKDSSNFYAWDNPGYKTLWEEI